MHLTNPSEISDVEKIYKQMLNLYGMLRNESNDSLSNQFQDGHNGSVVQSKKIMKSIVKKNKTDGLLEIFLAEIVGTAFLMYFGCMGMFGSLDAVTALEPMQGGFVFGFVVSSLIVAIGHISNAHLNPSVTLCAYLLGMITPITAAIYFVAECIGCLLGFWMLKVTTPQQLFDSYVYSNSSCGFCTTVLHPTVSISQGFLIEFLATSLLIYVVCGVWDARNAKNGDANPIKFALLIAVLSIVAGPFTGASLNPARSLAPAVINNIWNDHWIYWLAPLSGSAVTTMFYKCCFIKVEQLPEDLEDTMLKSQNSPTHETKPISEKSQNVV